VIGGPGPVVVNGQGAPVFSNALKQLAGQNEAAFSNVTSAQQFIQPNTPLRVLNQVSYSICV